MDIIAFNEGATANERIEKFNANPDSNSGIVTQPKVIEAGETVTIKSGRQAILANTVVEGELVIEAGGEVFVPSGATFGDLESQIATKATKQGTDITVNVGAGQTYTTINQALEYLSGFYPLYKTAGITATILLKSGFVMNEQVLVSGLNFGWINIASEDAEVVAKHEALTINVAGQYPLFSVINGGKLRIGAIFRFNVLGVGGNKVGVRVSESGSSVTFANNTGIIGAGTFGILLMGGASINALNCDFSRAGVNGIHALSASTASVENCNFRINGVSDTAADIACFYGSTIDASGAFGGTNITPNTLTVNGIIFK